MSNKRIFYFLLVELPDIGQKMYVDPMNYVDAEAALKEFANEIDPDSFSLEDQIGGGMKIFNILPNIPFH